MFMNWLSETGETTGERTTNRDSMTESLYVRAMPVALPKSGLFFPMKPPRNIIRINHERSRTHGWRVTLQRKGKIIVKTFSDGIYGGKRKALNAAIDCRGVLLSQYSTLDHQVWVRTRLRRNNTSGIPGVGRYEILANPNTGRRSTFWLASWVNEQGASRKRKFYVSCYGERQAKRLAITERERQLNRVCTIKSTQS
jgi:hypothetical protein